MRIFLIVSLCLSFSSHAWAWGEEGHSIVAEIAQHRLSTAAAAGVDEILGKGWSLSSVASWADDERARDGTTARWHFVEIPASDKSFSVERDCELIQGKGDCIIAAIERERLVVGCANRPISERSRALRFLVHLVGDVHQPLHTVKEFGGGNGVAVTIVTKEGVNGNLPFNGNLHSAWDATMIQKTTWSWGAYVDRLESGWLKTPEAAASASADVIAWAEETHVEAQQLLASVPANIVLDDQYRKSRLGMLDRQLGRGGIRLAALLNEAFQVRGCP
ncbi:S1/P1 nuclease [Rhizobium sp. Root1204]|uniref:S1/P1 nuclease n=1 Tax=Rhizobium sp. Root1204 TaxID=1736428 RepID=UPI000715837F|nr:S1/P1 nuclease [Rhizobium sp. Root1204]KQV41225.1 hypothetical protein ASC96_18135 [Rhizobium sp. Root1204]